MRILYVMSTNIKGGATIALVNIIKSAKARGHEVFVLTDEKNDYLTNELNELDVTCFQCSMSLKIYPRSRNPFRWLYKLLCLLKIWNKSKCYTRTVIKKIRPDIVHTNVGPLDVASDACKELGIPHIWHCREYQDLDFGMHFFPFQKKFRDMLRDANNRCIAITRAIFDYWQLNENKDVVLYDGVFSENQIPSLTVNKQKYFLFVGRIEAAKGTLFLLKVFKQFVCLHPEYQLLLAGSYNIDGPYYKRCIRFVEDDVVLKNRVLFLGNRDDVYQLMANATALVVPSVFEGFGFISVEAMLNNCLVIGKNTAGIKEQFDNGLLYKNEEIGLRFHNSQELLECMNRAVVENFDLTRMYARECVLDLYTIEKNMANLFAFYERCIKKVT